MAGTMAVSAGVKMVLAGGALASNIVWDVSGSVDAAAGAAIQGVILGKTSITLQTGATANGRLLSQADVVLQKVRLFPSAYGRSFHDASLLQATVVN